MGMFIMNKHIFLSFALALTAETSLANTFLDDLKTGYSSLDADSSHNDLYIDTTKPKSNISIPDENPSQHPLYDIEQRRELHAFTGDKCKQQSLGQWELEPQSKKNQHVTCYIGHFPESGIKTYMESNDDDDYNLGFSWEFE